MNRKEFLKMCALLGIGMPFQASISSCQKVPILAPSDNVIIIGAGAGGLTAGYLLRQQGVDVQILEASTRYGGRMKQTTDFTDFPIPLGAEWLHVGRGVFDEIVNDPQVNINVETTPYDNNVDEALFEGMSVSVRDIGFTIDQKFINSSWFDFYDEYVVPSVESIIQYNQIVESIDYSEDSIRVTTSKEEFTCSKVIIAVPVKILQSGSISFTPELPGEKRNALQSVTVWDGCKAFIQFSEKFYPTMIGFNITPETDGQKLYYDASYGQNSSNNILGLFAVGTGTLPYVNLPDSELIDFMLAELDAMFEGKASASYIKHIFQNWNDEPFARGAYVYDHEDWRRVRTLGEPVGDKVFFAGAEFTDGEDWSSVHTAARSAIRAVEILTS